MGVCCGCVGIIGVVGVGVSVAVSGARSSRSESSSVTVFLVGSPSFLRLLSSVVFCVPPFIFIVKVFIVCCCGCVLRWAFAFPVCFCCLQGVEKFDFLSHVIERRVGGPCAPHILSMFKQAFTCLFIPHLGQVLSFGDIVPPHTEQFLLVPLGFM